MDDLLAKHRSERKLMQAKVQSLKKSVTKGDRKKKKEIDTQIALIEQEFEDKCSLEIKDFESNAKLQVQQVEVKDTANASSDVINANGETFSDNKANKISKARKRKEKKELEEQKRNELIAQQEVENKNMPAFIELNKIKQKLKSLNLQLKDVRSDGNCMYYAICDQLSKKLSLAKTCEDLRELTCNYMLKNQHEFQPYLCSEQDGEPMNDEQYEDYCKKIRETLVWGGQLELKAISDVLKVKIKIIQADSNDVIIGEAGDDDELLVITYHRHMFGSGEHYNSTEQLVIDDEND